MYRGKFNLTHFCFKRCFVVFSICILSIEHSASKQWRILSDVMFYGVWCGSACLPMSHVKNARRNGLTKFNIVHVQ